MGTRVEQSGEFISCASRTGHRHPENMADSLHRLSSAPENLRVVIPCSNRALLFQGEFRISLWVSNLSRPFNAWLFRVPEFGQRSERAGRDRYNAGTNGELAGSGG